jgi:hypothetical protein
LSDGTVAVGNGTVVCRRGSFGAATPKHTEGKENLVSVTDDLPGGNQDRPVPREEIPNPETGVGIGARNDPDTFEPEEDPE